MTRDATRCGCRRSLPREHRRRWGSGHASHQHLRRGDAGPCGGDGGSLPASPQRARGHTPRLVRRPCCADSFRGVGAAGRPPRGAGPSQFLREKECPEQLLGDHQPLVLPAEPRLPRAPPSACSFMRPQSCTNKRGQSSHAAGPTCGRRRALRLHDSSRKSLLRTGRPGGCAHLSFFQKRIPRVCHGTKCCTCELARGTGPPSGPLLTHAHTCLCQ